MRSISIHVALRAAPEDLRAAEHVHRERRGRAQGVPAQRRRCDRELHRAQPLIALPCVIRNFAWLKWSCGRRKVAGKSVGILAGAACRHTKRKQGCTIETWVAIGGLRGSEARSRRSIGYRVSYRIGVSRTVLTSRTALRVPSPRCRNLFRETSLPVPVSHSIRLTPRWNRVERCTLIPSRTADTK